MGDSRMVPLTFGWVSLIWGVSVSCSGVAYSSSFLTPPEIGAKYSFYFTRSIPYSYSLASTHSYSHPPTRGLLSQHTSLSCNIILANISYRHNFYDSFVFLSSISHSLIYFQNTSDCFVSLFNFPHHHFLIMEALLGARSLLTLFSYRSPIC